MSARSNDVAGLVGLDEQDQSIDFELTRSKLEEIIETTQCLDVLLQAFINSDEINLVIDGVTVGHSIIEGKGVE